MQQLVTIHKMCTKCQEVKSVEDFSNDASRTDGKHPWCKECHSEDSLKRHQRLKNDPEYKKKRAKACKRWRENNPETYKKAIARCNARRTPEENKNSVLKSVYGISLAEYDQMFEEQEGVCAICSQPETRKSRYGGVCRLHVDHDHKTGEVRGLLCHGCNSAIGLVKEDVNTLASIISYLTK